MKYRIGRTVLTLYYRSGLLCLGKDLLEPRASHPSGRRGKSKWPPVVQYNRTAQIHRNDFRDNRRRDLCDQGHTPRFEGTPDS